MKKIVTLGLLGVTTSLMAMYAEQASLYKDPRVIGMGGANVAVGSYSSAVFSNPAGLVNIKKEHGYVVDLLNIGVSASSKFGNFVQDVSDAQDQEDSTNAVSQVLKKYSGQHFHLDAGNYSSISKNSDAFAWTVGLLTTTDMNLMAHGNGSANGGLLETSSRAYGGLVLGAAKPYSTKYGTLDVGMSLKYISEKSYEGALGASELSDNNQSIADKFKNRYEQVSSGFGVDIGATLKPFADNYWHPAFGVSLLNIGSLSMDNNYGGQPMTLNMGASVTPEVTFMNKLVVAVDYVDLLNANKMRIYNYNENDTVSYNDYATSSFVKNLRFGVGMGLVDTRFFSSTLNVGLYQGAYTAGLNMEVLAFKLNFATYEEEVGDSSTSITDRRYLAQIGIGW